MAKEDNYSELVTVLKKKSTFAESFRTIRTNIKFAMQDHGFQTMAVTSAGQNEGKSTFASNIAVVFANSGLKTLLVDADLRKPSIASIFNIDGRDGLSTMLSGMSSNIDDLVVSTNIDNLFLLPSGRRLINPSEMFDSVYMDNIIEECKKYFDLVIFDTPPIGYVTDAQVIGTKVDGVVLVTKVNHTKKKALIHAKDLLDAVNADIIGVVLNGIENDNSKYATYSYYGYQNPA
ncbi:MAG: CpsD/CapB family tyrosine-protein kinase [Lactobacillales bacterium]|jgi:capsular exopolysaccharide synthesis family protein|nr:CpsD/CapB family tyrosine-protein kinase [Lactobacillales bacterium]